MRTISNVHTPEERLAARQKAERRVLRSQWRLVLCVSIAAAEATKGFLGKPFPDFTVTDSEGKTFTLSEALKDHEAVLINF